MVNIFDIMRDIDAYLCPQPDRDRYWVCISKNGYFIGWGKTPQEAVLEAQKNYNKWLGEE